MVVDGTITVNVTVEGPYEYQLDSGTFKHPMCLQD
jgi:hypothetical protein